MTIIFNQTPNPPAPAVHILVIAVGKYPYLRGGSGPELLPNGGLGQLESSMTSAEAFCRWLQTEFKPRNLPLGSIEVLSSAGATFLNSQGQAVQVSTPSMKNVRKAVADWATRGDQHEDNFTLFYFCGHGVSSGLVHSLLLEDFGEDVNDPFNTGAIDAELFMDGVRSKSARSQLFLIDACRTVDHAAFAKLGAQRGAPIISAPPNTRLGVVEQACLWATSLGSLAYGIHGQPSIFMSAMLHAMQGGGAMQDSDDGSWFIHPEMLRLSINHIIQRIPAFTNSVRQYTSLDRTVKGLPVHSLAGEPSVPVKVHCVPASRNSLTTFSCSSGAQRGNGPAEPWHLDLQYDRYTFDAVANDVGAKTKAAMAHPPFSIVAFDYQP
ncbi:caspase family protein [Rugamonas sp. A1-17]|nr:caspase family protein [Rugamonas sp. A1-17]